MQSLVKEKRASKFRVSVCHRAKTVDSGRTDVESKLNVRHTDVVCQKPGSVNRSLITGMWLKFPRYIFEGCGPADNSDQYCGEQHHSKGGHAAATIYCSIQELR